MARAFNLTVFDQSISGGGASPPFFYTSQDHAALLGSVERLQVQIISRGMTTFSDTITVEYQITNAPEYDVWFTTTSSVGTLTVTGANNLPGVSFFQIDNPDSVAAYGRFRIKYTGVLAQVQLVVAGYSHS